MGNFTGSRAAPAPQVIAQGAVAVSHTGSLVETTLATVTIPAGAIGANGQVEVEALFSYTNNTNNKTPRVKFGGNNVVGSAGTTSFGQSLRARISNRNAANAQVTTPISLTPGAGTLVNAHQTFAVDTSQPVDIVFSGILNVATDTITLESYSVKLFPKA